MFEHEIKRIYSHNLNKVKNLGSYINFEQLITANLHPAILQYISAEIDYRIFEDRQKILKDSVFDYSGEKIRTYFAQISKELKKNKRFSQQYINKLILHAVSFNVNYLARPKWALLKFIYNNEMEKPADEIKQVLNYIHYYAYLRKILTLYIEKKNILLLSKGEFKDLLTKVDESGIESNQSAIVDKALESMTDFFNIGAADKSLIPLPSVKLFFQEKNLLSQLNKINHKFGAENKESVKLTEINNALTEKEPSLDEESEKIIKELVEQETSFTKTEILKQDSAEEDEVTFDETEQIKVSEKEEIQLEDESYEEDLSEDLGAGFVQKKLESAEFEEAEDSESINMNEDTDEELIADEKIPDMTEPETEIENEEEIQMDNKDNDDSELIIESELNPSGEANLNSDNLTLDDEQSDRNKLRLLNSDENQKENLIGESELEDSELEVADEEISDENEIEHDDHLEVVEVEEEEIIEIKDDVFVEEPAEEKETPNFTEIETDQPNDEKSGLQISDDDTLSGIIENEFELDSKKIDMSDLVQNKKMTKIIEVIFDYDMEDYSNTIEQISECTNLDDAKSILDKLFSTNRISSKSKEAHLFKELISEYFN
jgi:hypothetical protein